MLRCLLLARGLGASRRKAQRPIRPPLPMPPFSSRSYAFDPSSVTYLQNFSRQNFALALHWVTLTFWQLRLSPSPPHTCGREGRGEEVLGVVRLKIEWTTHPTG